MRVTSTVQWYVMLNPIIDMDSISFFICTCIPAVFKIDCEMLQILTILYNLRMYAHSTHIPHVATCLCTSRSCFNNIILQMSQNEASSSTNLYNTILSYYYIKP